MFYWKPVKFWKHFHWGKLFSSALVCCWVNFIQIKDMDWSSCGQVFPSKGTDHDHCSYIVVVYSCCDILFQNILTYAWNEPPHDKTNKMAWAPSEDSDPPSLIRVFAVRMKKALDLSAQRRFWSDWAGAQTDLSLRWVHSHFAGFLMKHLKYIFSASNAKQNQNILNTTNTICLFLIFYMYKGWSLKIKSFLNMFFICEYFFIIFCHNKQQSYAN